MEILSRISEMYPGLSKGKKKIARYMLDNKEEAAFLSAAEIAVRSGTSESAVVRFASDLGYSGYKHMQSEFQEVLRNKLSVLGRFRYNLNPQTGEEESDRMVTFATTMKNLNDTFSEITDELLDQVGEEILRARRIGVAGVRGSNGPALILELFLNEILDNTFLLTPGIDDSFDRIKSWDERDLIIGIAIFFNKNYTWEIMNYGKSKGCRTIAITDSIATALGQLADIVLPVRSAGTFPSYAATVMVVDMILHSVSRRVRENPETEARMKETEDIMYKWLKRAED